jgi:hypothetical protein
MPFCFHKKSDKVPYRFFYVLISRAYRSPTL